MIDNLRSTVRYDVGELHQLVEEDLYKSTNAHVTSIPWCIAYPEIWLRCRVWPCTERYARHPLKLGNQA